ncbi:hypothetical protein J6590_076244 [Homalodisca vitripennis]|nr:hypothetical protein J6590_076244 [Homalodisca vitripennis]
MYINGGESGPTNETKKTDLKTSLPTTSTSTGVILKTVQTGYPINPQSLVAPSADDGNISTDVDARLQSELKKYRVSSDRNSQQLRAELVRLARGGIAKSQQHDSNYQGRRYKSDFSEEKLPYHLPHVMLNLHKVDSRTFEKESYHIIYLGL